MQALKQHGIEKLVPLGHSFDPNLHTALFELPDPSKEAGTIGAVTKVGRRMTMFRAGYDHGFLGTVTLNSASALACAAVFAEWLPPERAADPAG